MVDGEGTPRGFSFPQGGALARGHIQERILQISGYCGVPTSGNALSRRVMEQIFPIPTEFATTSDDYLSVLIPLYGEVIAIDEELGAYRIHDNNQWALVELDSSRFRRFITHDLQRCALIKAKAPALGYNVPVNLETRRAKAVNDKKKKDELEDTLKTLAKDKLKATEILLNLALKQGEEPSDLNEYDEDDPDFDIHRREGLRIMAEWIDLRGGASSTVSQNTETKKDI